MAQQITLFCTLLALFLRPSTAQVTSSDVTTFTGTWLDDYAKDVDMTEGWYQWSGNDVVGGNLTYGDVGTYHMFRRTGSNNQDKHQYMARWFACQFDSKVQISFSISGCDVNTFSTSDHFRMYEISPYPTSSSATTYEQITLDAIEASPDAMQSDGTMVIANLVDAGCTDWSDYKMLDMGPYNLSLFDGSSAYYDEVSAGQVFQVYLKFKFNDNYVDGASTQVGHLWNLQLDCIANPTPEPTTSPSVVPTVSPTTVAPTAEPTTLAPTAPTSEPTGDPTEQPTGYPTYNPSMHPTIQPTMNPTSYPSTDPTMGPTNDPTPGPTIDPTAGPTADPTMSPTTPTSSPTMFPTDEPTMEPTNNPTYEPTPDTMDPTVNPTMEPTMSPTVEPTMDTDSPSMMPSTDPSMSPTAVTDVPTEQPTADPVTDSNDGDAQETIVGNMDWRTLTLVIILASLGLCCIFWLLIFVCWKRSNKSEEDGDNMTQMTSTEPATTDGGDTGV